MDHAATAAAQTSPAIDLRALLAPEHGTRSRMRDTVRRLEESYGMTVRALSVALELRDDDTGRHAERVCRVARELAWRVAPTELLRDPELEHGFLLHDLGKIGVPDAVLTKRGPLDPEEWALMRRHPEIGRRIVRGIPHLAGVASDVIGAHHERWDGGGYPLGLAAEAIPLAARIFAIADTYDAMTSDRPYRRALPAEAAEQEIAAQAGRQFDPQVVRAFLEIVPAVAPSA